MTDAVADIDTSNSLAHLAARIRTEHDAAAESLRDSVRHSMAAGELLIEAKALVDHGQWLPWLRDHCTISERTAQLYMRVAKNRDEIETQMRNGAADLSLNETAALLMLSSDVRKLLSFARTAEGLSGEELVDFCIANGVGVISTPNYDPFASCSEAEQREWKLFTVFLSCDTAAGRGGFAPEDAGHHVEYLLQKQFRNVDEWLGPEGDKWRRAIGYSSQPTEGLKTAWAAFRDAHRQATVAEIEALHETLHVRFEKDRAAGLVHSSKLRRRRRA